MTCRQHGDGEDCGRANDVAAHENLQNLRRQFGGGVPSDDERGTDVHRSSVRLRIPAAWQYDLLIESNGVAIVASSFAPRRPAACANPTDALLADAAEQVRAYFARRLQRFDLPLDLVGTAFQRGVWGLVANLTFGEFVSYADVARGVGRPLSHRGVAAAMRATPLDLFIPAHRVVGSDGRVRGATAGSLRARLVAFERAQKKATHVIVR